LIEAGWVLKEGAAYSLTPRGREQARCAMEDAASSLKQLGARLRSLGTPQTASKLTIAVQIVLALVKLPAGLLSGSVGLLNDSLDTILDLLSSLLVYLGVRFNRERLASITLVACMTATSCFTLYQAVRRFFVAYVPQAEWFPFFASLLSAVCGLSLWQYQRYIGRSSGSMAFIAESVDPLLGRREGQRHSLRVVAPGSLP
jgi:hypothetical protein